MRFLTIGETMGFASTADGHPFATTETLHLGTAGAEATVAIGLARLGQQAAWCGVVGDDPVGDRITRDLRAEGVTADAVRRHRDLPTGFMLRDRRTPDMVSVTYYRTGLAGSTLEPADVDAAYARGPVDVVHLTAITPAVSGSARAATLRAIELAKERGAEVSFDVNYRSRLWDRAAAAEFVGSVLGDVDVLFCGDDEIDLLGTSGRESDEPSVATARALLERGPGEVVLKHGGSGSYAATSDDAQTAPAMRVSVVDTIGAGDSFAAGYLAARAEGLDLATRLRWGAFCGARTVGTFGDWEGLPYRADLDADLGAGTDPAAGTRR